MRAQSFQRPSLRLLAAFALLSLGVIKALPQETPPAEPATTVTAEAHLSRGYEALKLDRYDVAVREFQAALTADPALSLRARFPLPVPLSHLHQSNKPPPQLQLLPPHVAHH